MAENQERKARSRISSKNEVTIPSHVLRQAGLAVGDVVRVEVLGPGRVVLTKIDNPVDRYSGVLATGGTLGARIAAEREVDWHAARDEISEHRPAEAKRRRR